MNINCTIVCEDGTPIFIQTDSFTELAEQVIQHDERTKEDGIFASKKIRFIYATLSGCAVKRPYLGEYTVEGLRSDLEEGRIAAADKKNKDDEYAIDALEYDLFLAKRKLKALKKS